MIIWIFPSIIGAALIVIGYQRAAVRYLASIVSAICLFIGYLWMLWDKEKQTWHDKLSNSVVVPASDYPLS